MLIREGTEIKQVRSASGLLELRALEGPVAARWLDDIVRIRVELYREFPYLYDGDAAREALCLRTYLECGEAVFLAAFDGDRMAGFSSSIPLAMEDEALTEPFRRAGLDPADYLYIGEMLVEAPWRSWKLLWEHKKYHEARARALHLKYVAMVTVDRAENHPLRPRRYKPLEHIIHYCGYEKIRDLSVSMRWPRADSGSERANRLSVWRRRVLPEEGEGHGS